MTEYSRDTKINISKRQKMCLPGRVGPAVLTALLSLCSPQSIQDPPFSLPSKPRTGLCIAMGLLTSPGSSQVFLHIGTGLSQGDIWEYRVSVCFSVTREH